MVTIKYGLISLVIYLSTTIYVIDNLGFYMIQGELKALVAKLKNSATVE